MNEEEKNAIDYLNARLYGNESCEFINVAQEDLRIMLNLIDKQAKEIEELKKTKYLYNANTGEITRIENEKDMKKYKEKVKQLEKENEELKLINNMQKYRIEVIDERELISKDKIRELINKRNAGIGYTSLECIEDIEQLLEE